jgi:hypothetical protein
MALVASPGRFIPSVDGFEFDNSWPAEPAVRIPTPAGAVGVGNAARGLCGGMVFAALDYWHAGRRAPAGRPAAGTPLYRFIVRRLVESWHLPAGVATYYQWMLLPDTDRAVRLRGRALGTQRGVAHHTIAEHWPRVRARLDTGRPVPLGVVTVAGPNPLLLGHNHQVLACAYRRAGDEVTIQVYDPNSGPRDDVFIRFTELDRGSRFAHNINIGWPVRGFFLVGYSPVRPPAR